MKIKAIRQFSHGSTLSMKAGDEAEVADALGKLLIEREVAEKVGDEPADKQGKASGKPA